MGLGSKEVTIVPVSGGYIIQWVEHTLVEPDKFAESKKIKYLQNSRTAVRETADGAMDLVKDILLQKMELVEKEAKFLKGGVELEPYGYPSNSPEVATKAPMPIGKY